MRRALGLASLLFSFGLAVGGLPACGAADDHAETGDDAEITEGSPEARAVLALVNDPSVTADELVRESKITRPVATAITEQRDGGNPFDTIAELRAIRGCGPASVKKLLEYAKRKGLLDGGGTEVVFSPQPSWEQSHLARIVREIDAAQKTIDVAIYSYSDAKITAALGAAVQRGVSVRFVYNDAPADQRLPEVGRPSSASGRIEAKGVDVRFVNKIMHHKFMIVDGPRDDLSRAKSAKLVTGSANWSNSAATRFDENTIFFSGNEELALRFQREFDLMWDHSRDFVGPTPMPYVHATAEIPDSAIPNDTSSGAFFTSSNFSVRDTTFTVGETNTVADALIDGIRSATHSIHIASGHIRSRPVSEALIAKKQASPNLDVRVYLDDQEYLSKSAHQAQLSKLDTCLANAGANESKRRDCLDRGFLFGYQLGEAGIDVRFKFYAYRWEHAYAPQMHHKYMVIDGKILFSGSYNLSDNAEHATFENMLRMEGPAGAALAQKFEANFESIWNTGRAENKLASLLDRVEHAQSIPLVFDPMALTWSEVTNLKSRIRANCTAADSAEYRQNATAHMTCPR